MDNLPGPSSSGNPIAPPALQQTFRPPSTPNKRASPSRQVSTPSVIATPSRQASTPNAFATPSGQSSTPNGIATPSRQISTLNGIATPSGQGSTPNALANLSLGQSSPAQPSPAQQPIAEQAIAPPVLQAPVQLDAYPNFRDGDVLIISLTGKTWRLHSLILSNVSPVIKGILASQEPAHITKKQRAEGQTIKWKLEMIDEPDAEEADPDGLKFKTFKAINVYGKPTFHMPRNINCLGAEPQYNKLYDNFFKCLYNLSPEFTRDPKDPEARDFIIDVTMLIEAANYLEAIPAVRVVVEANLLRLNKIIWKHLCARPEGWIYLAARLQSPLIFREAMLHIIGRFHPKNGVKEKFLTSDEHGETGRKIWDLIVKKAKELKDKKLRVERHLLEYYPPRMLHKESDTHVPGRAIYANDIYFWQALTIFRQYCGSAFVANYHHRSCDGGLAFYRTIAAGGGAYLRPETLNSYYQCFSMSGKGKACLAVALETIKNDMKPLVKDLLVDRSQGVRGKHEPQLDHLTCTEILDEEFPWYVAPVVQQDGDVEMSGAL